MGKVFKRHCDNCGDYYEGEGLKYCSTKCSQDAKQKTKKLNADSPILRMEIIKLIKGNGKHVSEIATTLCIKEKTVENIISSLVDSGYSISLHGNFAKLSKGIPELTPIKINPSRTWGRELKFGVVSDTHLGSHNERLDVLNFAYDDFSKNGIKSVYHAGNIVEGDASFNKYDVRVHGITDQTLYCLDHYPQKSGITTYYITADDHEGWWFQREGIDFGRYLFLEAQARGRKDLVHLGYQEVDIELSAKKGKSIMRLVHPGGGSCFDDNAEILTKNDGWIKFSNLTKKHQVATMTKDTHDFQWQKPIHITNEHYNGELIHFKSRVFDFRVTPNHNLWVRRKRTYLRSLKKLLMPQKAHYKHPKEWHKKDANAIFEEYSRQEFEIPTICSNWEGETQQNVDIPFVEAKRFGNKTKMKHIGTQSMGDIAELFAWYVTEGCADKKSVNISQYKNVNPKNYRQICNLFDRMGLNTYKTQFSVTVSSVELAKYIKEQCGSGSKNKHLPTWIKNQDTKVLRIIFDTMIKGDGWKAGRGFGYRSISVKLRDDISEIAAKLGYGTTFNGDDSLSIRAIQNTPSINSAPKKEYYNGRVYCCQVPNELIYVRSNGRAFWSHNSYAISYCLQKLIESFQGGEKPSIVISGHYHKAGVFYPREVHSVLAGCVCDQSRFMRKKKLQAHVGYYIIKLKQHEDGTITEFTATFKPFYDRGFYVKEKI